MTGRLIVDLAEDGTVTVGTLADDGELPSAAGSCGAVVAAGR